MIKYGKLQIYDLLNHYTYDKLFTLPMLFNLTHDELRKVIMFIELHGPANTYDHFFFHFTPE